MLNLIAIFKLFGVSHIIYILIAIVIAVGLYFLFRKYEGKMQKYIGIALVSIAGLFVILDFIGKIIENGDIFENLPFEPWHIFVYIAIYVEITKRESWIKFGYFIVVPLSVLGLFVAPSYYTTVGAYSVSTISYFLANAILILNSVLQLSWSGEYLSKKDIINCTINYIIIVAFVHIFNVIFRFTTLAVHSNYFGTMGEDYDVIMKFIYGLIPVPFVHMLPLFAILVLVEFLMILPFDLMKTKRDRREQMEELVALGNLKAQQNARKSSSRGSSQILINSQSKARPDVQKNEYNHSQRDGFVSVNKTIQTHKDNSSDK